MRMLVMMAVSLFTSRLTLSALGIEDFGIYNVVGGVVGLFGIVSGSLQAAISRFLTFELGAGNKERLARVFCTSINIQAALSVIILLIAETVGLWFLNCKVVIPEGRLFAANMVYQFSLVSCVLGLLNMPYGAAVVSHERMSAFAYMSIFDVVAKLLVVYAILHAPCDKLILFAFLLMLVPLFGMLITRMYSQRHFEECHYHWVFDRGLFKEMFGFAGWNFIGTSSAILRDQGGNIIINLFCGPAVNAARGIAMQVNGAVSRFVENFMVAVNPQITKSYAAGDYDYMHRLMFQSARFSFYILLLLSLPILITTPYLLNLWLVEVPEHTVNFVRLVLVFTMSESLASPLVTAMLATGRIRNYQIVVGGCQMLNVPISYVFLRVGCPPETVVIVAIGVSVLCEMTRIFMLRKMIGLSARSFIKNVYFNVIGVSLLSSVVPAVCSQFLPSTFLSFVGLCILSLCSAALVTFFVGCKREERQLVRRQAMKFKKKILGR